MRLRWAEMSRFASRVIAYVLPVTLHIGVAAAHGEEVSVWKVTSFPKGEEIQFWAGREKLERQPPWDLNTEDLPLGPREAGLIAKRDLERKGGVGKRLRLERVTLERVGLLHEESAWNHLWIYVVQFSDPSLPSDERYDRPHYRVVLLDGSVLRCSTVTMKRTE